MNKKEIMSDKEINTEQAILVAAKKIFISKGMDGARMQEIADEAGINKALLHYYFRSKDKLFEAIFRDAILKFIPDMMEMLQSDLPLFRKIEIFTGRYIDAFTENPFIPGFIMHELSRDPSKIAMMVKNSGVRPEAFISQINKEIEAGTIVPLDPFHLIVNILSMCIFPFAARPILLNILFQNDPKAYAAFIARRKKEVPEFLIRSIKKP
jgi:TetR/AcrR family transcriptional regulator